MDSKNAKFAPPGSLYPSPLVLKSDIVPRGLKPIFFNDSEEFEVSQEEIPQKNVVQMYLEREKQRDELNDKTRQALSGAVAFWFDTNDGLPFPCVLAIPGLLVVRIDDYDGGWTYETLWNSLGVLYNKVDNELIIYDPADPDPLPAECLVEYVSNSYAPRYVDSDLYTIQQVKDLIKSLNDGTYITSKAYLLRMAEYTSANLGWFPGQFPQTPYYHMVFWQGHSFYIPDRFEINEFLSRRSESYLVVEPINQLLKKRQFNVMKGAQNFTEFGGSAGKKIHPYLEAAYNSIPSWMRNQSLYNMFSPIKGSNPAWNIGAIIDRATGLPKQKWRDIKKVQNPFLKYNRIKILKYNVAAYGRNIDYPDFSDEYPEIYELTSPLEDWLLQYIRFEEEMEQRGIIPTIEQAKDIGGM